MWSGRAFQVAGPACENARSLMYLKVRTALWMILVEYPVSNVCAVGIWCHAFKHTTSQSVILWHWWIICFHLLPVLQGLICFHCVYLFQMTLPDAVLLAETSNKQHFVNCVAISINFWINIIHGWLDTFLIPNARCPIHRDKTFSSARVKQCESSITLFGRVTHFVLCSLRCGWHWWRFALCFLGWVIGLVIVVGRCLSLKCFDWLAVEIPMDWRK